MPATGGALRFSRPQAAAARLGDLAVDRHRFADKRVLLTGGIDELTTPNGAMLLLSSLRLLVRTTRRVTMSLPMGTDSIAALDARCRTEARRIAFASAPIGFDPTADPLMFDAVLSVGRSPHPGVPWTTVRSGGWLASVSSKGAPAPIPTRSWNPIGALGAAALGVTEVFRHLAIVSDRRARVADGTPFSFYTYESGKLDAGPALPASIRADGILVGCGAIGNGVVAALAELPLTGRLAIIDHQQFGEENLATCMLIGEEDVGRDKASTLAEFLPKSLTVVPFPGSIESYAALVGDGREPHPPLIVNALDDEEARRRAQGLWPDLAIDGAIGGDFMAQVTRHPWGPDIACLRCMFPERTSEPAEILAARASGLTPERTKQQDDIVRQGDVDAAPANRRAALQGAIGQRICSVVSAAVLAEIAARQPDETFEPSTAFVACLSSAMVAGELVKAACDWNSPLAPRFQLDALVGPQHGLFLPQSRRRECLCVTRSSAIDRYRALVARSGIAR